MKYRGFYRRGFLVGTILILIFLLVLNYAPTNANTEPTDGWTRLSDPLAVGGVISHLMAAPSNPDILYALQAVQVPNPVSQHLYRSQDGGASWQLVPNENHIFTSLAVDPENPDVLYATENHRLLKSMNAGQEWTVLYPFGETVVVPVPDRIYLVGWVSGSPCTYTSEFARSLDGGETWERSSLGCGELIDQIFVDPAGPERIFVTSSVKSINDYSSLDGGTTWQTLLVDASHLPVTSITFDPQDPEREYLASREIWTTDDNGDTWTHCGSIPETFPLILLPVGDRLYAIPKYSHSTDDPLRYIYLSEDHCATWWKSIHGLPATVNSLIGDENAPGRLLAATGGYGVFTSATGGATWQESNIGLSSPVLISKLAVAPGDPNVFLAGSYFPRPGLYRSSDGGLSWSPALLEIEPLSILIHPLDPQKAWISARDGIYSTDDNVNWSQEFFSGLVNDLAIFPGAPDTPYAVSGDGEYGWLLHFRQDSPVYYWQKYMVAGSNNIQALAVNPWDTNDLLAGGTAEVDPYTSQPVVYRSLDGGQTWYQVYSSFYPMIDIVIDPHNPQNRYLLTGKTGIQRSTDSGETWEDWSAGTFIYYFSTSSLALDDFGGVFIFTADMIYYRAREDSGWQIVTQDFHGGLAGALWRGDAPFLLNSGWDGLWRKDLPPIHKTWLPALSK